MHFGGVNDPRRRSERHPAEGMRCQIGDVVDLSGSGMRILCKGKPPLAVGQCIDLKLRFADGAVALHGQAMWMRRAGLRRHEIGVRFLNLRPPVVKALESLAKFGFLGGAGMAAQAAVAPAPKRRLGSRRRSRMSASINLPDYYAVLGVSQEASPAEIKAAFRILAARFHPDVAGGEPRAAEKFARVHEAYDVLKDSERRAMYDLRSAA